MKFYNLGPDTTTHDLDLHCSLRLNMLGATCDVQQCGILTSIDSDKPVQPLFKLRNCK